MSSPAVPPPGWSPDDAPPPVQFVQTAPLGGVAPVARPHVAGSDRRDLALVASLLVLSVVAGAASLMSWRDFGRGFGQGVTETGWVRPDGSMGRGWLAVLLAVVVAVSGVLIAAERSRWGRAVAVLGGMGLVVLAVAEWGLGAGPSRIGPGLGIWIELAVGVLVVVAVGAFAPKDPSPARSG